ncbi:hypothetical protein VCHA53O466_140087 [Vibrio chagasii]|nr:hypothetical protein VCHA53O466_140087 [Vibrio chagasii]
MHSLIDTVVNTTVFELIQFLVATGAFIFLLRYALVVMQLFRANVQAQKAHPESQIVCRSLRRKTLWQAKLFFSMLTQYREVLSTMTVSELENDYYLFRLLKIHATNATPKCRALAFLHKPV